jgi:flagellar motor switch protein FliM
MPGPDDKQDDDLLAAEWEAMAAQGDTQEEDPFGADLPDAAATRVLNQDEIDSLLGFDDGRGGSTDGSGIAAIVNASLVSYERLPMLEVVFERLQRTMSTSLRNFTSDNVEVSLDNITAIRFGDYLNSIPLPAMIGVFKA